MANSATRQPDETDRSMLLSERLEALAYIYVFNVVLLMVMGRSYLSNVPAGTSLTGWVATVIADAANFGTMALIPLIVASITLPLRRFWVTLIVAVILYSFLNVCVYVDAMIYQLWRFHFNGMVLNLLTTPGAGDSVTAGAGTIWSALIVVAFIIAAESAFAACVSPVLRRFRFVPRLRTKKSFALFFAAVCSLLLLDKVVYDIGDLRNDTEIVRLRQLLPLYQTVTIKGFAIRRLGMKVAPRDTFKIGDASAGSLDYPKAPIKFRADGPRPNIVIIAIEGARFDMLTPPVMPFLSHWGEKNLVFEQNYSAGNTTRYGIFGLFYGIYGTYWPRALAEKHGPVLISALKQLGYHFRILCCTDLNFPEFRRTAFIEIPDTITDTWKCERVDRDREMTDEFTRFLDQKQTPFLAFMFYDASHQGYRYPPEHAVFDTGTLSEYLNYVRIAHGQPDMVYIENRYKNSLHYVDAQIARAMQALEQRGLMDNTLVVICGDHGEEFGEFGLYGHDSAFHRYQTQTLMVAHVPGVPPQKIQRMTSHLDVPATILTYMGAENPLSDYTVGSPLTSTQEVPYVLISSWSDAAVVDHDTITTFGLEAYKAEMTIRNHDNVPFPDQRAAMAVHRTELLSALNGMRQFSK
jgi:uncharacterized protein